MANVAHMHIIGLRDWNGYALAICTKDGKIDCDMKWQHILQYKCIGVYSVADVILHSYVSTVLYWYLVVDLHCASCWHVPNNNNK